MQTTCLSNNGNVNIPEFIRTAYGWGEGLEFVIIDVGKGILFRPLELSEETQIEDVLGCTGYKGPKISLRDMEDAIAKGTLENLSVFVLLDNPAEAY